MATGQARVGSSDVDLLAIDVPADVTATVRQSLSQRFANLCRAVEVGAGRISDYAGDADEAYGNRVFLRHYCVHIWGPPPPVLQHDYPADARAARGFNGDVAIHAERWRIGLEAGEDHAALARRVSRKTLLAVAGLVSVHDRTWTTDRAGAAGRWAEVEPGLGPDLRRLVRWTEGQEVPRGAELARVLDGPVAAVVGAFESTIGLWRQ